MTEIKKDGGTAQPEPRQMAGSPRGYRIRTNDEASIFHIYHTAKLYTSGKVEVETSLSAPDFEVLRDEAACGFAIRDGAGLTRYPGLDKEDCKRAVFSYLKDVTGLTIPWGTLIGVRPTKLATARLNQGEDEAAVLTALESRYLVSPAKSRLAVRVARTEAALLSAWTTGEVGVYIDLPFCPTKCFYCSFLSYPSDNVKLMARYHEALLKDIAATGDMIRRAGLTPGYLYFGGGTPTAADKDEFEAILDAIGKHLIAGRTISEFTVEAGRPDTITPEKLGLMKAAGVTRISINPQTFNDDTLARMGRTHTGEGIRAAFTQARALGFADINMDFILGLPGETAEDVARSIRIAAALGPENITIHGLALKKGSRLAQGEAVDPLAVPAMYDAAYAILEDGGYEPYYLYRNKNTLGNLENVGFTRPGCANRYNIAMIEETDSIIAAGASGITRVLTGARNEQGRPVIERHSGYKDIHLYLDHLDEVLADKEALVRKAGASLGH